MTLFSLIAPLPALLVLGVALAAGRRLVMSRSANAWAYGAVLLLAIGLLAMFPPVSGTGARLDPRALLAAASLVLAWFALCQRLKAR